MQLQVCWSAALTPGWTLEAFGSKGRFVSRAPSFPTARDTTLHAGSVGGAFEQVQIPERLLRAPGVGIDADFQMQASYPMALSVQNMIRAIKGEAVAAPDFGQAWFVERVLEAARRSAAERRWVRIEEVA